MMTKQELESLYIQTQHGEFTPLYTYDSYDVKTGYYTNLIIVKDANVVYKEWLENNTKPQPPSEPSKTDILLNELSEYVLSVEMQNIEIGMIASENSEYVLSLDERITNIEQGGQ